VALVTCTDCGREVSERAETCPGCGGPIASVASGAPQRVRTSEDNALTRNRGCGDLIVWPLLLLIILALAMLAGCADSPVGPSAPPAVWPVSTNAIAGTSIVSAETERDSRQSPAVWLNVNCANDDLSAPGGQVIVHDLRDPFDVPFVFTDLYPPSSTSVTT
jgi:hypothetical protein